MWVVKYKVIVQTSDGLLRTRVSVGTQKDSVFPPRFPSPPLIVTSFFLCLYRKGLSLKHSDASWERKIEFYEGQPFWCPPLIGQNPLFASRTQGEIAREWSPRGRVAPASSGPQEVLGRGLGGREPGRAESCEWDPAGGPGRRACRGRGAGARGWSRTQGRRAPRASGASDVP